MSEAEPKSNAPGPLTQASGYEKERRREICKVCPHRIGGRSLSFSLCGRCGCPITSKTALARSSCPMNKWGPDDEP
jgi:hypothetical protein